MISECEINLARAEYLTIRSDGRVMLDPIDPSASEVNQVEIDILRPIFLREVAAGGRKFCLRRPICVVIDRENGFWLLEYPSLRIHAYGHTIAQAQVYFADEFVSCWDGVAMEEDAALTLDAQEMKSYLKEIVAEIEEL